MANESQEIKDLRAENAKLQKTIEDKEAKITSLQNQLAATASGDVNQELETLRAKVLSLEQSNQSLQQESGIFQFNETYQREGETYKFAPGRRKFTFKGVEYTVEDAIQNEAVMNGLIDIGYSGLIKQGGQ